jgi:hypothetical protein
MTSFANRIDQRLEISLCKITSERFREIDLIVGVGTGRRDAKTECHHSTAPERIRNHGRATARVTDATGAARGLQEPVAEVFICYSFQKLRVGGANARHPLGCARSERDRRMSAVRFLSA